MVKQVVIEETDVSYLKQLPRQGCTAGLIVGCVTPNKDYVARLIKCPTQIIGEDVKEWKSVKVVDGSWIAGHAGQVLPSLPGGISVIGLFIKSEATESKLVMEKLKQALYQTYKLVSKTSEEVKTFVGGSIEEKTSLFWTVFHSDLSTGYVLNCRQYDVKDNKDPGRPVEIKQMESPIQWDCLETTIHVDNTILLPDSKSRQEVFKSLRPFCKRMASAHVVINGNYRPGTEVLNQSSTHQTGKGSKKKKATASAKLLGAQTYSCEIFFPISEDHCNNPPYKSRTVHISGAISAKAYLCPGSNISESTYALKYDIIQSIQQRCSILSEDIEDLEQFGDLFKSFPRRVYVKDDHKENGILFSEYILPEEPPEDCLERLEDNLDVNIESNQLVETDCLERFNSSECEPSPAFAEAEVEDTAEPMNAASRTNAILALVATAVATIAWMFSGLFVSEN